MSVEGESSFLNIHNNLNVPEFSKDNWSDPLAYFSKLAPKKFFKDTPDYKLDTPDHKFNLNPLLKGKAVITDKNGLPAGLYLADLESNDIKDIFLTMDVGGKHFAWIVRIDEEKRLILSPFNSDISKYSGVIRISVADVTDSGKNDILINYNYNGVPTLDLVRVKSSIANTKLSLITSLHEDAKDNDERKDIDINLPGITYLILYENKTKWKKSTQMNTISFPSMQHQGSYIGLGPSNIFLNYVLVRTNCAYREKKLDLGHYMSDWSIVVPNSSVVFHVSAQKWNMLSFYLSNRRTIVTIFLIILLGVNFIILLYLTMRERNTLKKVEMEENMLRPIFAAL